MIRGGSVEFRFTLPYNFSAVTAARVYFWQTGYSGPSDSRPLPILKTLEQCRQGGKPTELGVVLNQEETLRFTDRRKARVQMKAMSVGGVPVISPEYLIPVYSAYDDSIFDGENWPDSPSWPTPDGNEWIILDGKSVTEEE